MLDLPFGMFCENHPPRLHLLHWRGAVVGSLARMGVAQVQTLTRFPYDHLFRETMYVGFPLASLGLPLCDLLSPPYTFKQGGEGWAKYQHTYK